MANVILIGMMGTGKSSVGKVLSEKFGWPFVDTDERIVVSAGMSINEIFAHKGEQVFRRMEREVLREVLAADRQVVTTGGGSVLLEENRLLMRQRGWVCHLYATAGILLQRLKNDTTRPLLQGDVAAKIDRLLRERAGYYDFAHLQVDTSDKSIAEVAAEIERFVRNSEKD